MYGWRARLGVLVPSGVTTTESDFVKMAPEGVSCHFHRFAFIGGSSEEEVVSRLKRAEEFIGDASEMITHARPAAVAMTGTGVSFIGGYGYDQMLIKKIQERNGNLPTTTTSSSMIDAFRKLGIAKVSIAMPYVEKVARAVVKFVEDSGVGVVDAKWLNLGTPHDITGVSRETLYRLVKDVDTPESEAVFIGCVDLRAIGIIEHLETALQKPVISSNQATLWNLLRLAGIKDSIKGFGRLLSDY